MGLLRPIYYLGPCWSIYCCPCLHIYTPRLMISIPVCDIDYLKVTWYQSHGLVLELIKFFSHPRSLFPFTAHRRRPSCGRAHLLPPSPPVVRPGTCCPRPRLLCGRPCTCRARPMVDLICVYLDLICVNLPQRILCYYGVKGAEATVCGLWGINRFSREHMAIHLREPKKKWHAKI